MLTNKVCPLKKKIFDFLAALVPFRPLRLLSPFFQLRRRRLFWLLSRHRQLISCQRLPASQDTSFIITSAARSLLLSLFSCRCLASWPASRSFGRRTPSTSVSTSGVLLLTIACPVCFPPHKRITTPARNDARCRWTGCLTSRQTGTSPRDLALLINARPAAPLAAINTALSAGSDRRHTGTKTKRRGRGRRRKDCQSHCAGTAIFDIYVRLCCYFALCAVGL